MSGSLRTRASLATAAAMGLILTMNLSSAASGTAAARPATTSLAVDSPGYVDAVETSGTWDRQRPAPDSPSSSISPKPSVSATATASPTVAPTSGLSKVAAAAATSTNATAKTTKASTKSATTTAGTPPAYAGYSLDWSDNFTTPLDQTKWARYGYGGQAPGQGAMGVYQQSNAFTANGNLVLRTQYSGGAWSSAGVSSGDFYSASGGRWELRAKFPVAKGIGYVFLLWPADGSWPPELDMAEGRVNGPQMMSTYHWGSANNQDNQFHTNTTMSSWHTYGVIFGTNTITYTFDGKPWMTINNSNVTTKKMWIGFQCAAMDPNGSANQYETVDGGVPGPLTPAVSDIQIDWVAHYAAA